MNKKFLLYSTLIIFAVLFSVGYVFHEPLMGAWFHEQEASIARQDFIIPFIAIAFLVYSFLLAYFFVIYRHYYADAPLMPTAIKFGIVMGVVFDALQGGLIEVATFNMPFSVFLVNSGYHVFVEGTIAGLVLAFV